MPEEAKHIIDKDVLMPLSLVITIAVAGVTFGVMSNKVDKLDATVSYQTEVISSLREQSARQEATISQVLTTLSDIKRDVSAIRDAKK